MATIFIKIVDITSKQWIINLDDISTVQQPGSGSAAGNVNLEIITMRTTKAIQAPPGTIALALVNLFVDYNENPQPSENVKGHVFVATTL
jgi:hypothetical protein